MVNTERLTLADYRALAEFRCQLRRFLRFSEEAARARIIAAGNIVNALFMTGAAVVTALLIAAGFRTPDLYLMLGIMNAGVALWICKLLPPEIWRLLPRILRR